MYSINPYTEQIIDHYHPLTHDQIVQCMEQTQKAFLSWQKTSFSQRSALMLRLANLLTEQVDQYAALISKEMGKLYHEAQQEIKKSAWVCQYYAEHGEAFLSDQNIAGPGTDNIIVYQPIGSVFAVMPWNFPFWQVFRFAIPALMAGNCALLKHAANVCGCALAIEKLFMEAGFPEHVFTTLLITTKQVASVIAHPAVQAVTLTGSTKAGSNVAGLAGRHLKKTILELGGSDPYIVLADADIKKAAQICAASRLLNAGQSCIAAKRFIIVKTVLPSFLEAFQEQMQHVQMGDPCDRQTSLAPLCSAEARTQLHKQVQRSIRNGARCILGGEIPKQKGYFYPPTILTQVKKGMAAYDEELFGPVAAIIEAEDEEQAIRYANDSAFGLGAALFTADSEHGRYLARHAIAAGMCAINNLVQSDPRMPFGGIKHSGYGRELGVEGIRAFTNVKTITVSDKI